MRPLIVGCGYVGWPVVRILVQYGEIPLVITRSVEKADRLRRAGAEARVLDIATESPSRAEHLDGLIMMLGDDRRTGDRPSDLRRQALQHVLQCLGTDVRRVIYVSTTGVYGERNGWVDEETVPRPTRRSAHAHWLAESWLMTGPWRAVTTRLRLGGLYGPGRLPEVDRLRRGEPLHRDPTHRLHLIHVEDAARIIVEQWRRGEEPEDSIAESPSSRERWAAGGKRDAPAARRAVLNVVDGCPVSRADFYEEAARLAGWPPPRFGPSRAGISSPPSHDLRPAPPHRVIRSRWFETDIAPYLKFPDYRAGLRTVIERGES